MTMHVLCFKWGAKYGPEYVNRLFAMVKRNLSLPFAFHCFTDDSQGIRSDIECHPLPELDCPVPVNVPGMWRKTAIWRKDLAGIDGRALFVDLDSVIVDAIDPLFEWGDDDDVILARNWLKPLSKLGQTTLFRFKVGAHAYLLEQFQKDSQGIAEQYRFEQHYVTQNVRGGVKFWPKAVGAALSCALFAGLSRQIFSASDHSTWRTGYRLSRGTKPCRCVGWSVDQWSACHSQ